MENLGKLGRDKVTGFEGIITAKATHLYGCETYYLTPRVNKEGKRNSDDSGWFDVGRVEIIGEGIHASEVKGDKPGGEDLSDPGNRG